jgi:hypothetical protein
MRFLKIDAHALTFQARELAATARRWGYSGKPVLAKISARCAVRRGRAALYLLARERRQARRIAA